MSETTAATTPEGLINLQKEMIYLEGNKQRVERQDEAAITDLYRSIIYVIDKQHRVYAVVPLKALSSTVSGNPGGHNIKLDGTGKTRIIASHPCDEYRAIEGNGLERVTISACVSTNAPGAREASEFERRMIGRITGRGFERSPEPRVAALMLERQSVLSFRIPDPSRRRPYRMASLLAETRINKIQPKPLPRETFRPPKGFIQSSTRRNTTGVGRDGGPRD
jgi:hypothetical protein